MKKLYLVSFSDQISRRDITSFFDENKSFGMWFYSMPNSIFVFASINAKEISDALEKKLGKEVRHMVCPMTDYCGRMPSDQWKIVNNGGASKRYDLNFIGYYRNALNMTEKSGVYCVYRGLYLPEKDSVTIKELLYIGQAKNVRQRHENHEGKPRWSTRLEGREELWYTYAEVDESELNRCEAALIFASKPPCNDQGKESFGYLDTYIAATGCNHSLKSGVVEQCLP